MEKEKSKNKIIEVVATVGVEKKKEIEMEKARMMYDLLKDKYPPLLEPRHIAELLGASENTIKQWISQERGIPYKKIGGFVRFPLPDVAFYLVQG